MIYNAAANGSTAVVSVDKDANKQYNLGLSWTKAISPSTGRADYAFDSAYCLRRLAIGRTRSAARRCRTTSRSLPMRSRPGSAKSA